MIYFKQNNDKIEKYHITFNQEEIEQLKSDIIKNCSFIKHVEYSSDYEPKFDNISLIKNFHSTYISKKEYFEETRDVYFYSYDEYQPPYLIELINNLLTGDSSSIDKILNYCISNESIDDKIKLINQEINEIDISNIESKKEKLKELENLLEIKKLNKNRQNIDPYYQRLISLIKFDLVDTMSICEIERVNSCLKENNLETNKVLNLHKN